MAERWREMQKFINTKLIKLNSVNTNSYIIRYNIGI